jgi:hypothetical protein
MAKAKTGPEEILAVEFLRTGISWVDAGIVGLYRILNELPSYTDSSGAPELERSAHTSFPDVRRDDLRSDRLVVSGSASRVQACLEWAYDRLVGLYYNKSSEKQRREKSSYNFYYDRTKKAFVTFSKVRATGVASLLFDKAARPSRDQAPWGAIMDDEGKEERTPGRLPTELNELQAQLDDFMANNGLKPGPPAGLLIDGPNQVRPKVEIRVGSSRPESNCFLTGVAEGSVVEAKETAFPLMGGSRSFISGNTNWPRLGWKADFVGKFVPAVAFYYQQDDDLHVFFPESSDLQRTNALVETLSSMIQLDPNLYRNFDLMLGGSKLAFLFRGRSEVALAFLHRALVELSKEEKAVREGARFAEQEARSELELDEGEETEVQDSPEPDGPEPSISAEDVFRAVERQGHVSFAVVSAAKKGNVWMARDFWSVRDVVYLARLFERMQSKQEVAPGRNRIVCSPKKLFMTLVDFEAKDEGRTLVRDRACSAILRRESVLALLERHAFHINPHTEASKARPVQPLLDFVTLYEVERHKGTPMDETYQKMVKTATWLGGEIGKAVSDKVKDKDENESRGRARGALFRLRNTRTTADFMKELARLQFRYDIDVPRDVLDGAVFNRDTFEEFRGFCVVSALSRFIYGTREPKNATTATR